MEKQALSIREETQRIERETLSPYAALSENTRGRVRETAARSEERRVGEGWRSRWAPYQ